MAALSEAERDLLLRAVGDTPSGLIAGALAGLGTLWADLRDPTRLVVIRWEARKLLFVDLLRRIGAAATPDARSALDAERLTLVELLRGDADLITALGGITPAQATGAAVYTLTLDYLEPVASEFA